MQKEFLLRTTSPDKKSRQSLLCTAPAMKTLLLALSLHLLPALPVHMRPGCEVTVGKIASAYGTQVSVYLCQVKVRSNGFFGTFLLHYRLIL